MIKMILKIVPVLALAMPFALVSAQGAAPPPPQLVAHGRGEVEVTPDRAELIIRIETRASLASAASERNAVFTTAVLDTLQRGLRLATGEVSTAGFQLRPEMVYPSDGRPPTVSGYVATNTVRVRTAQVARVGAIIDAAISRGSTSIVGPNFFVQDPSEARRRALSIAVQQARRDAEVMAAAAGGVLGDLIEIVAEPMDGIAPRPMVEMQAMRVAADTPIELTDIRVLASILARWQFRPRPD